jgi:hypothetical protein
MVVGKSMEGQVVVEGWKSFQGSKLGISSYLLRRRNRPRHVRTRSAKTPPATRANIKQGLHVFFLFFLFSFYSAAVYEMK